MKDKPAYKIERPYTVETKDWSTRLMRLLGPGAGLEVTAAGVLNDCIQLARVMA